MRRILAAAAALIVLPLVAVTADPATAASGSCPSVIAHRTSPLERPENTLAGIEAARASGAKTVEMDVQWSSSGFPVLMHDTTVDRTTNGAGAPSSLSLSQLGALSAADYGPWNTWPSLKGFDSAGKPRTPVPYGGEFMPAVAHAGLDVLLHISATPTQIGMDKLEIYISREGWNDHSLVMADAAAVKAMRAWEPSLHYAVIEYNPADIIRRGESVRALGAQTYVVPVGDVSPAAVAYWHSYGLRVYAWTTDGPLLDVPDLWSRMADAGVDQLITNRPADARALYAPLCP